MFELGVACTSGLKMACNSRDVMGSADAVLREFNAPLYCGSCSIGVNFIRHC